MTTQLLQPQAFHTFSLHNSLPAIQIKYYFSFVLILVLVNKCFVFVLIGFDFGQWPLQIMSWAQVTSSPHIHQTLPCELAKRARHVHSWPWEFWKARLMFNLQYVCGISVWVSVKVCVFVQMNFPSVLVCMTMHVCLCVTLQHTHTCCSICGCVLRHTVVWVAWRKFVCVCIFSHWNVYTVSRDWFMPCPLFVHVLQSDDLHKVTLCVCVCVWVI